MAIWEGSFQDIDPLTLSAIVQIQLDDAKQMAETANAKGKQREGSLSDSQLALELLTAELQSCEAELADRKMAQSLAMAALQDGQAISEAIRQEDQVARDRMLAMELAGGREVHQERGGTRDAGDADDEERKAWLDEELLSRAGALYISPSMGRTFFHSSNGSDGDPGNDAESSTWAATRKTLLRQPNKVQCVACAEDFTSLHTAEVPCEHNYCLQCLAELFRLSMGDETLFPPRCCGDVILVARVRMYLPPDLVTEFEEKFEELSTKNRTYCHDVECAAFIPPGAVTDSVAKCTVCGKTTCAMCKAASHSVAECFTCNRIIALETGCSHMTCPCGAQFCYVCGREWTRNGCPVGCAQWNEQRLLARATQIVDREPNRQLFQPARVAHPQPGPSGGANAAVTVASDPSDDDGALERAATTTPADRMARIAQAAAHLRENHECEHDRWRWAVQPAGL